MPHFHVQGAVGETITTSEGNFTIQEKKQAIGPFSSGALTIEFDQIQLLSGEVTDPHVAGISGDSISYIQVDMIIQNTGGALMDNVAGSLQLETGGHSFTAHSMFSGLGVRYEELSTSTPQRVSLVYMINDTISINDIYSLYGLPPHPNDDTDPIRFSFSFHS